MKHQILCLGIENNVEDTIIGEVSKGQWNSDGSGNNPGSHAVNLTWHNNSLLSGDVISGLSEKEIYNQLAFGEEVLGIYDLTITVEAEAFEGVNCQHTDNGEEVESTVSLLVIDFEILSNGESVPPINGDDVTALGAGDGEISSYSSLHGLLQSSF